MDNNVLAVVNGQEITQKDLDEIISRFPKERQAYFMNEQGKSQLLNQIVSFELIYNYAKDNEIEKDEEYIKRLENTKKEILTQTAINKLLSDVNVTDEEIKKYYEANKHLFKEEESVTARHILVNTLDEAEEIKNKIDNGMNFEAAAIKYSTCPSKEYGGNLGSFTKGKMVPEFEKAAFELPVGVVSEPVKTQFGYHLIKVENKNTGNIKPFEEVYLIIKNELLNERQSYKFVEITEKLKKEYDVVLNYNID